MTAFVNSPAHYQNIVDPSYNYIGVGVSYDANGRMFTTHDFMALGDGRRRRQPPPPFDQENVALAANPAPAAAPAPALPPAPPPTAPATSGRLHTVLTALRAVDN